MKNMKLPFNRIITKQMVKRIVSVITAAVMLLSYLVFPDMPGVLKNAEKSIISYAADGDGWSYSAETGTYIISSRTGLVEYSQLYAADPQAHENDIINLSLGSGSTNETLNDFVSLGSSVYPFKGELKADSSSQNILALNTALFDYLDDSATITLTDLTITRFADGASQSILANHVTHSNTGDIKTWTITIANYHDSEQDTDTVHSFGGIIGEMNADSKLVLNVNNNIADVSGSFAEITGRDSVGLICGTMGANANLTANMNTSSQCAVKSINGSAGGLVGSVGSDATLTVNISASDVELKSVTGFANAGGIIGEMASGATATLDLNGHDFSCPAISCTDGNAGGIVGSMAAGATLKISNTGDSTKKLNSTVEGENAGGLVGSGSDCTISFGDNCQISGEINGTANTGGVYGTYTNGASGVASIGIASYNINCTLKGTNAGGLFGTLINNRSDLTFTDSANNGSETETFKPTFSSTSGNSGGIIGVYQTDDLTNSLIFDGVSINPTLQSNTGSFGGLVGAFDGSSAVYMKCTATGTDNKINVSGAGSSSAFGGLVGDMGDKGSFLDVQETVTITANGYNGGGLVCTATNGVIRLSGTTDLSAAKAASGGQLVNERGQTLIYSNGTGSDTDWTFKRSTTAADVDDIGTWGEVFRDTTSVPYGNVIDESNLANHYVTLQPAVTSMQSTEDFVKTALNIQLNSGIGVGALQFADTSNSKSSTLLESAELSLSGDVDLTGTGITGLTRDDGRNNAFTGTFNGNNHTINLAIGEAYGKRNETEITNTYENSSGSGRIYYHTHNGLFAKVNGATIQNLTLGGAIYVSASGKTSDVYVGGVSAYSSGAVTLLSVTANETINANNTTNINNTYVGGLLGHIYNGTVNVGSSIAPCVVNSAMTVTGNGNSMMAGGVCGYLNNSATLNLSSTTIKNTLTADGSNVYVGGIVGQSSSATINITSVDIDGYTLKLDSNTAAGALIGHKLENTNVTFNNTGLTVGKNNDTKIAIANGTGKDLAGLACIATGYWQVESNGINLTSLTINNGSGTATTVNSFGLLVNTGRIADNNCLYLELQETDSYNITSSNCNINLTTNFFDELVAQNGSDVTDVCANGRAIVSIATKDHNDAYLVDMDDTYCNTYQNRTTNSGSVWQPNPNIRYYYNLDEYRTSPTEDEEKLLIWSVYTYAGDNIKTYFNKTTIPASGTFDMKGYSYYPVDFGGGSISGTYTFYNAQIEANESNHSPSDKVIRSTKSDTKSQHYLMHCGLFRNVSGNLNVTNATFSGSIGQAVEDDGSGAIVCGTISHDTDDVKTISLDGITLNGITVNGGNTAGYAPLLINTIGSKTTLKVKNVTASGYASTNTPIVATSLIGNVGNADATNMTVEFSKIVLDGRTQNVSGFTNTYGTSKSIFSKATLLNRFSHSASDTNSDGVYNFEYSEDWNADDSAKHEVTYGYEIDGTTQYANKQLNYYGSSIFTHPTTAQSASSYNYFKSNFRRYVATPYNKDKSTFELRINHASENLKMGCGTYNDPYIITSGGQLEALAKALDDKMSTGFTVNYPNSHTDDNGWCEDKTAHTAYTYDGSTFKNEDGTKTVEKAVMIKHLSHAYYSIEADLDLGETTFNCIGGTTPFTGVIIGKQGIYDKDSETERYPTITNNTTLGGIISNSYGCVVKDVIIKLGKSFSYNTESITTATTFSKDTTGAFGGVINQVLGGDNIIDNVVIDYNNGKTFSSNKPLNAIGGYIGVVVDGGVYFRNMTATNGTAYSGFNNSTNGYYYQNPYIGRVINGFAVYETTSFGGNPILDNGTKNYVITNIKEGETDKLAITGTGDNTTIEMPNAQSIFVLGAITQSGAGKANYGANNYRVHNAQYNHVGAATEAETAGDYALSQSDNIGSSDKTPRIIKNYVAEGTSQTTFNSIIVNNPSTAYYFKLTGTEYDLSKTGFRGINGLFNKDYIIVKGFDGNGNTINLDMLLKNYGKTYNKDAEYKDNYHIKKQGNNSFGFFNYLNFADADEVTTAEAGENSQSIHDLTLSGSVVYDENTKDYSRNYGTAVGGLAGVVEFNMKKYINLINVDTAADFTVKGIAHVGGLIGVMKPWHIENKITGDRYIYIANCDAAGITVNGYKSCGGILGYKPNNGNITVKNCDLTIVAIKGELIKNDGTYYSNVNDKQEEAFGGVFGMLGYKDTGNNAETLYVSNSLTISDLAVRGTSENNKGWIGSNTTYSESGTGTLDTYSGSENYTVISGAICGVWVTKNQSSTIDNFEYTNIKLYGGECGGVAGCAGRSNGNNTETTLKVTDFNAENVEMYVDTQAGGIIGILRGKMTADLDGVTVKNLTMKKKNSQSGMDANFGALLGLVRNDGLFQMKNVTVDGFNLTMCKEGHQNIRVGALMGGLMENGECKGYNILLKDINIIGSKTNKGNIGLYKVIGGTRNNRTDYIQIVGLQIDNFNAQQYSDSAGKYYDGITLEPITVKAEYPGLFKSTNQTTTLELNITTDSNGNNVIDDTTSSGATNSYIIYNDYHLVGDSDEHNISSPKIGTTDDILDDTYLDKAPNILANPSNSANSDYFLFTGDGAGTVNQIKAIFNDTFTVKVGEEDVTKHKYINADGIYHRDYFREGGSYYNKVSTFKNQVTYGGNDDFSVIIVDSITHTTSDDIVNGALQILTNFPKDYKPETVIETYKTANAECKYSWSKSYGGKKFYDLTVTQYKYDSESSTWQIATAENGSKGPTLQYDSTKNQFYMENDYVDSSSTNPQFNLIDIAFYDPTDSDRNKVAYHLYLPIYVKKQIPYTAKIALLEGSDYYDVDYNDKFGQTLVCNLGTPATAYVSFEYQYTLEEWQGAIDSGEDLNTDVGKSLTLQANDLPPNTKYVLVDKTANGKTYYLDSNPINNGGSYKLSFNSFKDADDNTPIKTTTLCDILVKQADEGNITLTAESVDDYSETNPSYRGQQLYQMCNTEADIAQATIRAKVGNEWKWFKPDTTPDNPNGKEGYLITLAAVDGKTFVAKEDYYLTFLTESTNESTVYNIGLVQPSKFDAGNPPTKLENPSGEGNEAYAIPHLILGNFYTHTTTIKTYETGNGYVIDSAHNKVKVDLIDRISMPSDTQQTFDSYSAYVKVYQEFIMQLEKRYKDSGSLVKELGIVGNPSYEYTYYYKDLSIANSDYVEFMSYSSNLDSAVYSLELGQQNEAMDLKTFLANAGGTKQGVEIKCEVEITYSSNYSAQFPVQKETSDGTYVKATSNIGTDLSTLAESTAQNEVTADASNNNKWYYIEDLQDAKLTYNVPKGSSSSIFGSYSQLGINARLIDENEDPTITGAATYSLEKISESTRNSGKYIKLTLTLHQKTNTDNTNTAYSAENLLISFGETAAFLKNVSCTPAADEENLTFVQSQQIGNKLVWIFEITPDAYGQISESFSFSTSFDVTTGERLNELSGFYSNYKVLLEAELLDSQNSENSITNTYAYDHLIYTNAKLCKEILSEHAGS